jgi:hypothetical protein
MKLAQLKVLQEELKNTVSSIGGDCVLKPPLSPLRSSQLLASELGRSTKIRQGFR